MAVATPRHRHIAITGASSGIGAALAREHAAPGVRLALAGRNSERLEAVAQDCRARGAEVSVMQIDVAEPSAVALWIDTCDAEAPLDLVYANAGLGGTRAVVASGAGDPDFDHAMIATNLGGVVATARSALARYLPRRRGHIVLVGSLAGRFGLPQSPVYSATKAAVAIYADGLRRLAPPGIHVTLVEPGYVRTPMSEGVPGSDFLPWAAERAARAIRTGVEAQRHFIRFPWLLSAALRAAGWLPRPLADAVLSAAKRRAERA